MILPLDGVGQFFAWEVRTNGSRPAGPAVRGEGPAIYSPDLSRCVVRDADKKQWLVKSRGDGAILFTIPWKNHGLVLSGRLTPTWSPNSRLLTWNDPNERSQTILDVQTGKELPGSGTESYAPVTCWLPNSERLLLRTGHHEYVGDEPMLRVVDVTTGEVERHRITHHAHREYRSHGKWRFDGPWIQNPIVWSPNGERFLSVAAQDKVFWNIWNARTSQMDDEIEAERVLNLHGWPKPDVIVGWGGSHSGYFTWKYDLRTKLVTKSADHGMHAATTKDGRRTIFLDTADKQKLRIVDAITGTVLRELTVSKPFKWACLSDDATLLATSSEEDPDLKIWSLEDGSLTQTLDSQKIFGEGVGRTGNWVGISFSQDSTRLVAMNTSALATIVWDLEKQELITKLDAPETGNKQVAWLRSERFAITQKDGLRWYDRDGELLTHWKDEANGYDHISFAPDGRRVAVTAATYAGEIYVRPGRPFIQIRDIADGRILSTHCVLPTEFDYDLPLSFGPTGHWHGPEDLEKELIYIAVTEDDRRLLLTPKEFEQQFGWKNDPKQVAQPVSSAKNSLPVEPPEAIADTHTH